MNKKAQENKKQKKDVKKTSRNLTSLLTKIFPFAIAIIVVILATTSLQNKSSTNDEHRHLVRGAMLLETGDYRLNKHHPLFANVVNAIPQVFNPNFKPVDTTTEKWDRANKDGLASELKRVNGGTGEFEPNVLNYSRYVTVAVFAISIVIFYFLILKEFGLTSAAVFTTLYAFSPNILAHARLVTTDAWIIIAVFWTTFVLYKYLKEPTPVRFIGFIILSFISLLTKYSTVPIVAIWLVFLAVFEFWRAHKATKSRLHAALKTAGKLGVIVVSWILLLTAAYGFRFTSLSDTNHANIEKTENHLSNINNIFKKTPLPDSWAKPVQDFYQYAQLPFPEYIQGFVENVIFHNIYGHDSYLFGDYNSLGWWYYFPAAIAVKTPVPVLMGILALVGWGCLEIYKRLKARKSKKHKNKRKNRWSPDANYLLVLVPVLFLGLSMRSTVNLGLRHVLVIYPFIYLGIGLLVQKLLNSDKKWLLLIVPLGIWYLLASFSIYPHYLEYFNEPAGGPKNGYKYLLDSNLSWGQNEILVNEYVEELDDDLEVHRNPADPVENGVIIYNVDTLMGTDHKKRDNGKWLRDPLLAGEIEPADWVANTHMVFIIEDGEIQ